MKELAPANRKGTSGSAAGNYPLLSAIESDNHFQSSLVSRLKPSGEQPKSGK